MASSNAYMRECWKDQPVLLAPCDGTSATDYSRFGRNGSVAGGTAGAGFLSQALSSVYTMDGTNTQGISWSDNSAYSSHAGASGEQTLEAWVRPASLSTLAFVWSKSSGATQYEFACYMNTNGSVLFEWSTLNAGSVANFTTATGIIQVARTYHIAATYDRANSDIRGYINGRPVGRVAASFNTADGTGSLYLGARGDASTNRWNGAIGWFGVYSTALQPHRIRAHYRAGLGRLSAVAA